MRENLSPQPPISTITTHSVSKNERKVRVDDPKQSMVGTGTGTLPILQAELLKPGKMIEEGITGLTTGIYAEQSVTIQQAPSQTLTEQRESLAAFAQLASPFWLPVVGICEGVSVGSWVTALLPSTSFATYLSSPASESWINRCRLVRDVAVGVYQRRALGANHIAWDTHQLYLDQEGRAQLFPLIREKPGAETDDVFALGQLIWQVASRSTILVEGWQTGKGLPRDCPPEVLALIKTCTDPVVSARPSLKSLAKGLDAFWQQAVSRFSDPLPSTPTMISPDEKEKKSTQPSTQPLSEPLVSSTSSTHTSTDLESSGGLLSILLVDDQMVSWLSVEDPRYSVGVKLCALRDHPTMQLAESKVSTLSTEIQKTLLGSSIEMLLWLDEDGVDPSVLFANAAQYLWQASAWRTYRPGDPPLTTWLPLWVNIQSTPLFTLSHQLSTGTHFTEAEWRELHSHYALFWLVQGADTLTEPCNLYETNELYRAAGRIRLVLHTETSVAYKLEESTYLMPHDAQGHLLPMRYARFMTDPAFDISTWEGRYQGAIGGKALKISSPHVALMPAPDLAISLEDTDRFRQEKETADSKNIMGTGHYGQVVRSTYGGHTVAVKHFKQPKLSADDEAQLKQEAAIMAKLHSDFLVRVWGLSFEPPLLVMELVPHSLVALLTDSHRKLSWAWRYRLLRDAALGLAVLHQHELLHRDLKSANILVDANGRAKLCDFGISILTSTAEEADFNGTPSHTAPEVIQGTTPSTAADVYSFGVVCWEVALRREADHAFIKIAPDIQKGRRGILPSDCPSPLAEVIYGCCAKAPGQRPDIRAVAQVLEGLWQDDKKFTVEKKFSSLSIQPAEHTPGFKALLATSSLPCWQDLLSAQYTVGIKLQRLRQTALADPYITQELSCYIAPNGQSQPGQPSDPLYPWVERELLRGNAQVLVLQGVAGAGKSTFHRHLLRTLWQDPAWQTYRPGDPAPKAPIPVWIPLGSGQVHPSDLWDYYRHLPEMDGFTTAEIAVLKKDYQLVWLADGYDEIPGQVAPNLYDLNQLGHYQGRVKLIIGCRSQRLQNLSEADALVPHPAGASPNWSLYRTRHVASFTPAQTQDYIDKYVAQHHDDPDRPKDWDAAHYKKEFAAFPELQTFIDTPFMLWMTLSILPSLASEQTQSFKKNKDELKEKKELKESKQSIAFRPKITRAVLYDRFMETWFTRQARKAWQARSYLKDPAAILGKPNMQAIKERASQTDSEDVQVHWLKYAYRAFCLTLAQQLTQAGQVSICYEKDKETKGKNNPWEQLLGDLPDSVQLRQGCPLRESSDHSFSFIHASLLDYFLTTAIAETLILPVNVTTSTENTPFVLTHAQAVVLLGRVPLTPEQVRFFADRVAGNIPLQDALFAVIERSKTDSAIAIASANAATVLNACGINLSYQDWQNVQLSGADLRYGQLAYTNLQGANLRGATLMRTILYRANLQAADLRDVRWGEWPRLQLTEWVYAVAQHPIQPWVAVGQHKTIVLLHTETGERIGKPLEGHMEKVTSVSFSPDGGRIVSGSDDSTLRLWDLETQLAVGVPLEGHTKGVTSVSFSPDERQIVSGSMDATIRLWDVETQQAVGAPLEGHTKGVTSVSFSPDGWHVVSGGVDATLRLWDVKKQQAVGAPLKGHTSWVTSVSFSPDGMQLVSGSWDQTVRLWDVKTQQALGAPLRGHTDHVTSVSFSLDGRRIVSGSMDNTVRLWDVETQQALGVPLSGHMGGVNSVSFSPDGRRLISGSDDRTLHLWDVDMQEALRAPLAGHTSTVHSVSFSPDGRRLVSGSYDKTLLLWNVETQQAVGAPLEGHTKGVTSVSFSPDGWRLVSGSVDATLLLWDVKTQKALGTPLTGHTREVRSVSFSPDGRRVASGSLDATVRLWDVETQQALGAPFKGHRSAVMSVSFSPDGRQLVSGNWDETLRLWDVGTQEAIGVPLKGHVDMVISVSFSPDGRRLVSGGVDGTLRLWDMEMQQAIGVPLEGHTGEVESVSFSPDGRCVVSGSDDMTVRLWDIESGQCVAVMHWHQPIKTLAIVHPKTSFTIRDDLASKSSRRLTFTMSAEEDLLAIGDTVGTISFWAVSHKDPAIRFLDMPRHSATPLLVDGIALQGCRMDALSKRLLAQYRADVSEVELTDEKRVMKVVEEKQPEHKGRPLSVPTPTTAFDPENEEHRSLSSPLIPDQKCSSPPSQPLGMSLSPIQGNLPFTLLPPPQLYLEAQRLVSTVATELQKDTITQWDKNAATSYAAMVMTSIRENQLSAMLATPKDYGFLPQIVAAVRRHLIQWPQLAIAIQADMEGCKALETQLLRTGELESKMTTTSTSQFSNLNG